MDSLLDLAWLLASSPFKLVLPLISLLSRLFGAFNTTLTLLARVGETARCNAVLCSLWASVSSALADILILGLVATALLLTIAIALAVFSPPWLVFFVDNILRSLIVVCGRLRDVVVVLYELARSSPALHALVARIINSVLSELPASVATMLKAALRCLVFVVTLPARLSTQREEPFDSWANTCKVEHFDGLDQPRYIFCAGVKKDGSPCKKTRSREGASRGWKCRFHG